MAMKPWYKVVTPREDLREGKALDASEFAVHLDHVRNRTAPDVYKEPAQFFDRTYLTKNLKDLATQTVRRLSGVKLETSAVFNLSTQFGGGKTHALTLLYHLARGGNDAKAWKGVGTILQAAEVKSIPKAATAVLVGTELDSISGRGGGKEPLRKTPWGEVAFQLGGAKRFQLVEQHEKEMTAPGGDVIEKMLPRGEPALILMDELMNYVNRSRKSGMAGQLYTFVHNLSEVARGRDNVVLAVSIPASELEMTAEDQSDFTRFKKLLDRLGKAIVMSAEAETSEIIRRRLFEWETPLPKEANATIGEFEAWFQDNKQQLPQWFPVANSGDALRASYPFHPSVLSVFERKWQGLPRFQQTRGMLRLLALWVSRAYKDGYDGAHKDPLVTLGSAPLDDPMFRSAMFEQLGEPRLEAAVTTDIAGKEHAHAIRLDNEAASDVKKARLHRKVGTAVFFESNGGQNKGEATLPEVRLAVAEPGVEFGSAEQCLDALAEKCYYLTAERNKYRFSFAPNLNKVLADRRAKVTAPEIEERIRTEVQKVFTAGSGIERAFFPRKSGDIPDRPVLVLGILAAEHAAGDTATKALIQTMTVECGNSSRTFKSAIIWAVAEDAVGLQEEARKLIAWKDIAEDEGIDDDQQQKIAENVKKAERDLKEAVWRAYKNLFLLGEDNAIRRIDLGLVHSDGTLIEYIIGKLKQADIVSAGASPNFLARNWPPALPEWSTKSVRDAFYASPKFPRLLIAEAVKDTISKGLDAGVFAYVCKAASGKYEPFIFKRSLPAADVEIAEAVFLISKERAEAYLSKKPDTKPEEKEIERGPTTTNTTNVLTSPNPTSSPETAKKDTGKVPNASGVSWTGEVAHQKWMNFYTKVLSPLVGNGGLKISIEVDAAPTDGLSQSKLDEIKTALRELGLSEHIDVRKAP